MSRNPEVDTQGEQVPWRSGRSFRLWRYGVGHSQLLLRSPAADGHRALGVLFEGVEYVMLRRTYPDLVLRLAGDDEVRSHADGESMSLPRLWIAVQGGSHAGLVRCSRVSVHRTDDPQDDSWAAGALVLSVSRRRSGP